MARPDLARWHAGADLRGTRHAVTGLARAVGHGDIARPMHMRAVPWRGERPRVGHAGHRWPLAPPGFPLQPPQRRARRPGSQVSLTWRWRLGVATERHDTGTHERFPPAPPEVTDAGSTSSPAWRGAVTSRGTPDPRVSREVGAEENSSHGACR